MNDATPVAIVTGAAQGIGHAIVERLLADGYRVVASDINEISRPTFNSDPTNEELCILESDVGSPDSARLHVEHALSAFGRIDALVNNAGIPGNAAPASEVAPEEVNRVFDVNVHGAVKLCQAVTPHLRSQRSGRIINMGSVFADQPVPEVSPYCMSKAAIRTYSNALALELGPHGITVNTVAPGYILTQMHSAAMTRYAEAQGITPDERASELRDTVPLKRHGTAEEIAGAVAWLLSVDASYVTGQTIRVNGGLYSG